MSKPTPLSEEELSALEAALTDARFDISNMVREKGLRLIAELRDSRMRLKDLKDASQLLDELGIPTGVGARTVARRIRKLVAFTPLLTGKKK